MAEVVEMIRRDVEDDFSIKVHGLTVDVIRRGFLVKHRILKVTGSVPSEHDREKIVAVVNHHAGDGYELELDIAVREPAEA